VPTYPVRIAVGGTQSVLVIESHEPDPSSFFSSPFAIQ
jgi:hypothetical protein